MGRGWDDWRRCDGAGGEKRKESRRARRRRPSGGTCKTKLVTVRVSPSIVLASASGIPPEGEIRRALAPTLANARLHQTPEVEPQRADASGAAAARDAGLAAVDVRAGTFAWAEDAAPVLADISLQGLGRPEPRRLRGVRAVRLGAWAAWQGAGRRRRDPIRNTSLPPVAG